MNKTVSILLLVLTLGTPIIAAYAQPAVPRLVNSDNQDLHFTQLGFIPVFDNMNNVFGPRLTELLRTHLQGDLRWKATEINEDLSLAELQRSPDQIKNLYSKYKIDALLAIRVINSPAGVLLRGALFIGPHGKPFLVEESTPQKNFEFANIQNEFKQLLVDRIFSKLPFDGYLVSRRGLEVTMNLGSRHGLKEGSTVSVVHILKVHRHPVHQFAVSSDREIIGKVRISKAEENLSFGHIILERDAGLLAVGDKVSIDRFIQYEDTYSQLPQSIHPSSDQKEWVPRSSPQFGRVSVSGGLNNYTQNLHYASGISHEGKSALTPTIDFAGEAWVNKYWFLGASYQQAFSTLNNPRAGSSPSQINLSLNRYDLWVAYHFMLSSDFLGPRILFSLGYSQFTASPDSSSPPVFGSMNFGGGRLGVDFLTPINQGLAFDVGGFLRYPLWPHVIDNPNSGNPGDIAMDSFGFSLGYRSSLHQRYFGQLRFYHDAASFYGQGERDLEIHRIVHRGTTLSFGFEYLF